MKECIIYCADADKCTLNSTVSTDLVECKQLIEHLKKHYYMINKMISLVFFAADNLVPEGVQGCAAQQIFCCSRPISTSIFASMYQQRK